MRVFECKVSQFSIQTSFWTISVSKGNYWNVSQLCSQPTAVSESFQFSSISGVSIYSNSFQTFSLPWNHSSNYGTLSFKKERQLFVKQTVEETSTCLVITNRTGVQSNRTNCSVLKVFQRWFLKAMPYPEGVVRTCRDPHTSREKKNCW